MQKINVVIFHVSMFNILFFFWPILILLNILFQEEGTSELDDKVGGCCKVLSPFDYDHDLIPPEPNFFTAGFSMEKEDR